MVLSFFYLLNFLLLFSGVLVVSIETNQRRFSLGILQVIAGLPLLAGEYLYLIYHLQLEVVQLLLFSEIVFSLMWLSMSMHLSRAVNNVEPLSKLWQILEIVCGVLVSVVALYFLTGYEVIGVFASSISFYLYNPVFFSAVFILLAMLYAGWRLEEFYRGLGGGQRREYNLFMVGSCLAAGTLIWSCSYRLTYLALAPKHLLLISLLLFFAWMLILYAVVHHRLLARKSFISRKVVYSFVVPAILSVYLFGFGVITMVMKGFGVEMAFVFKWLLLVLGFVVALLFAFSPTLRRHAHFFISTHFYASKYEYRDEWLALSTELQGARSEIEVVRALRKVLADCLYASEIFIWLGDFARGYQLVACSEHQMRESGEKVIVPYNKLVMYLTAHPYFYMADQEPDEEWREVVGSEDNFLLPLGLSLVVPLSIGRRLVGFVGLSSEFTGGHYGHDDFDLLTALCGQTASNVLAARIGEKLAQTREEQAWSRLSAFVLHDIKNAATMLSLLQENAPAHIHEPEFQEDMLELVDDALKRMGRIEQQLTALHQNVVPKTEVFELNDFLHNCTQRMLNKLGTMKIRNRCQGDIMISSDKSLFTSIIENIFINAFEAGEVTLVDLETSVSPGERILVKVSDNGPGIAKDLLPDGLFQPFKTNKEGGSGIGLWQVKRLVSTLGGTIEAGNNPEGGAFFLMRFPKVQGGR